MTLAALAVPLAGESGTGSFRLQKADIRVEFLGSGERRARERLAVEADHPLSDIRIDHTVFLEEGDLLSLLEVRSSDGPARVEADQGWPLRRLTVFVRSAAPRERFDYTLELAVSGQESDVYRCPLAVPLVLPRSPHRTVTLEVLLPPGQALAGQPFPNLRVRSERLAGSLGAIPAFVRVPYGDSAGTLGRLRQHAADALVLLLVVASASLWLRLRGSAV